MSAQLLVTDEGFTIVLKKAANLGSADFRTAFRRIARDWMDLIMVGFESESDPYGNPWTSLSKFTFEKKGNDAILIESGAFMSSFHSEVTRRGLTIDNSRVFENGYTPAIHQFGGVNASGKKVPARPFVPHQENFPLTWEQSVDHHMGDYLDRYFA